MNNPYVIFASNSKEDLEPIVSAPTKESAIVEAKKLQDKFLCIEAIYMPIDDLDTNKIIYSYYN